jgi:signal transduction histidine kinase
MKKLIQLIQLMLVAFVLSFTGAANAADTRGTAEEAMALVKKAGAFYKANGREKAIAAFNDHNGEFVIGDLYVAMLNINGDGIALAHGQNPKMVGKNILGMKTADDRFPIVEFLKIANGPGHGWYDYKWPNTVTKLVETKHTYIERFDDVFILAGSYIKN